MGNQDHKIGDPNNFADADEVTKEHSNSSKKKITSPSSRSRGIGRRRMNVEQETTGSQEDSEVKHSSEVKNSTLSSDEDSHKRQSDNYNSEGMALRRSNRKRKQVTYMEDGHEADDNDVPMHQVDENGPIQAAADRDIAGPDAQSNLLHQDTSELNSDQIRTDPDTAKDTNEYPSGFELCEDQMDSAPKEYLFTGGGFCMEEGDEQDTAGDPSGTEMENGTSDACEDIAGFSDSGKIIGLSNTGVYRECKSEGPRCIVTEEK